MFLNLSFQYLQLVKPFRCAECQHRSWWFCCVSVIDTLFTTKLWCQYQSSNGKWLQWSDCYWNCYSTTWRYPGDDAFVLSVDYISFELCCVCCVCVDVQPPWPDYISTHHPPDFFCYNKLLYWFNRIHSLCGKIELPFRFPSFLFLSICIITSI